MKVRFGVRAAMSRSILAEQLVEQVEAAVDVAHRIGARARLAAGGRRLGGCKTAGKTFPDTHKIPLLVPPAEPALKLHPTAGPMADVVSPHRKWLLDCQDSKAQLPCTR